MRSETGKAEINLKVEGSGNCTEFTQDAQEPAGWYVNSPEKVEVT